MSDLPRWEYAELTDDRGIDGKIAAQITIQFSHQNPPGPSAGSLMAALRALGDDGWEAVTAHHFATQSIYLFKRPRPPTREVKTEGAVSDSGTSAASRPNERKKGGSEGEHKTP